MDSAINGLAKTIVEGLPECWGDQVVEGQITINLTVNADIMDELIEEVQRLDAPRCRICGCTDNNACPGGCYWVEEDLCSQCVETDKLQDAAPELLKALEKANQFITNGVEFGYIRMPNSDCPDAAHETPDIIRAAIAKAKGESREQVQD